MYLIKEYDLAYNYIAQAHNWWVWKIQVYSTDWKTSVEYKERGDSWDRGLKCSLFSFEQLCKVFVCNQSSSPFQSD